MSKKTNPIPLDQLSKEMQEFVKKLQTQKAIAEKYHQQYFGHTPSIKSSIFKGKRVVLLGGSLIGCDDQKYDWKTPSDFLLSYLKTRLGNDWFNAEKQKSKPDQHEIIKWYLNGKKNIDPESKRTWGTPNGNALALLHLAYDLFVLDNKKYLSEKLITRLKNAQNFNGARYEIFVFATLIRAGFDLENIDEGSGQSNAVVECRAKFIPTNEYISVEAKTRNVKDVLGAKEGNPNRVEIYSNLRKAVDKNPLEPYVIFMDLNISGFSVNNGQIRNKIQLAHSKLAETHKDKLPNLICYTNIPFHYGRDDSSPNHSAFAFIIFHNPKYDLINKYIIQSIQESIDKYAFLPKSFNESEKFSNEILNNNNKVNN